MNYIQEFLRMYNQTRYNISYREMKKIYQESNILLTYITKSKQPIMKMMRRVQKRVQQDSRRRTKKSQKK